MNYTIIVKNGEKMYLKTKISIEMVEYIFEKFITMKAKSDDSFQKYLNRHGIDAIYDGTFGYINIDERLKSGIAKDES